MRFLHLGDLHIGKRINERSLIADQEAILRQLSDLAIREQLDAVLLAGDVFDRAVPTVDALEVCERFFADIAAAGIPLFAIAGNHDSAERLSFGSRFMGGQGIHIEKAYRGTISVHELQDEWGPVHVHLMPFIKPTQVRLAYPEEADAVTSYHDAVRIALEHHTIDTSARNILLAHQFVIDGVRQPETCESETISVGGLDHVEAALFDEFEYVALGHLHGRQSVRRPEVRYCGSPLKYSFSEVHHVKTASLVSMDGAGRVSLEEHVLQPLHDMRELTASYEELRTGCDKGAHEDYLHIILTDDNLYDAADKIRALYPNFLRIDWQSRARAGDAKVLTEAGAQAKSPLELFGDFYRAQSGAELTDEQRAMLRGIIEEGEC